VARYINASTGFDNVSILYTDGAGQVTIFLQPYVLYKFYLNCSGYEDEISDWIPSDLLFTHTFMMDYLETGIPPDYIEIVFVGERSGATIYMNFTDAMGETINSTTYLFYFNETTGLLNLVTSFSNTSESNISYVFHSTNTSLDYRVLMFFNHTVYGPQTRSVILSRIGTPVTTPATLNALLVAIIGPAGPFIWTGIITFLAFSVMMFHADRKDAGKYLIIIGGVMAFIGLVGFHTVIASGIPVLFVAVGIIVEWINARRN